MDDAFVPCTILCYMIQGSLESLTLCIARNLLLPVVSLGGRYASDAINGSAIYIED